MKRIYVVGTADTKGEELAFIAKTVSAHGGVPFVVNVGTRAPSIETDISAAEVASHGDSDLLKTNDRGKAVSAMATAFAAYISQRDDIGGILGIGGGGGTSIITAGMQKLPIGTPKIMVSTLASGDTAPYVGASDIVMMPSITDLAGLNRISRVILSQASAAIVAMSAVPTSFEADKPAVGLTMFGVTTEAVTQIMQRIERDFEAVAFHATGTGGRTMEALVDSGLLSAVIDITTTEIADFLFDGVLPAGPDRLDCIARTQVPYVGSVGACDMINFWAPDTVPANYADRLFYLHNANVTLMRTNAAECRKIGEWIGEKLNRCNGLVEFLIPELGVSALDIEGGAFYDPDADRALFKSIEKVVRKTDKRQIVRVPYHINSPAFADAVATSFSKITS